MLYPRRRQGSFRPVERPAGGRRAAQGRDDRQRRRDSGGLLPIHADLFHGHGKELSHRSLSTFKRDFRKYYNQSPGKWLSQKRLDYSAVLLKNPALNVSQVALDCGFEDLSHFSRAFKEKFGTSPAKLRWGNEPGRTCAMYSSGMIS